MKKWGPERLSSLSSFLEPRQSQSKYLVGAGCFCYSPMYFTAPGTCFARSRSKINTCHSDRSHSDFRSWNGSLRHSHSFSFDESASSGFDLILPMCFWWYFSNTLCNQVTSLTSLLGSKPELGKWHHKQKQRFNPPDPAACPQPRWPGVVNANRPPSPWEPLHSSWNQVCEGPWS